jgi:hypothetical protein
MIMKTIPWSVPNLYNLHSNPEKLDGYSDDLHYLPTATQIYDSVAMYENWGEQVESWGSDEHVPPKWSLDFFIRQRDDLQWEYDNDWGDDADEYKPSLLGLSEVQLGWLHDFITVRYGDLNIDYNDKKGMVDAFAKFYKNGRIKR